MSWNNNGNNGNNGSRDPWGGKDGPPDIDEALKKFREQFSFLFGKKTSSGGGDFKPRKFLTSALAVISILYAALGIYTVDAQEQAVVMRFGEYVNTKGPGIHWNPPIIDTRTIVNTEKLFTHTATSSMLTKDENIVIVEIGVQYKKSNPVNYLLEASTPDDSLAQASEAALRHVVGSNIMDDVLTTGREQIAFDVKDRLQQRLDDYLTGIEVVTVNVKESKPPDAVREAFDDVVKAREDEVRLRNQAETYANEVVPIARGDAQRTIQDAEGYKSKVIAEAEGDASRFSQLLVEYKKAPEVTRQRLYLDAVQSVMDSSTKVMIDVQDGNNILYLPLDKIASAAVAADRNNSSSSNDQDISIGDITDQVIEEIRKRQERR